MNIQQLRAQIAVLQDATMDENRNFRSDYDEGRFDALSAVDALLDSLQEEPVSDDVWEASKHYALRQVLASTDEEMSEQAYLDLRLFSGLELAIAHKDGANWREEQVKKNLIAYCDNLTKEQVQVNYDFVADHLKKSSRTPSYIDAIEYGKKIVLAELERIVKDKEEAGKNYVFAFSEVKELVKKMSKKGPTN